MSTQQNFGFFVDNLGACSLKEMPMPKPEEGFLLVQVSVVGMNPADLKHPKILGVHNTIIGDDFCGVVVESRSSKFKAGDVIAGYTPITLPRPLSYGSYQNYLCCEADMCFKVPEHLPAEEAAALTTVTMTAADALFNRFDFPLPTKPKKELGPLLIWGASTSVGICTVQYARAVGCRDILVTASPSRHELLISLGATKCFDYASPSVIEDIQEYATSDGRSGIEYALDAVGSVDEPTSAEQMRQCCSATEDTVRLASSILRADRRFALIVGFANRPFDYQLPGQTSKSSVSAEPEAHWRAWDAFLWVVERYGRDKGIFFLPKINVVNNTANDVLEAAKGIAAGTGGFGKTVFKLPLKTADAQYIGQI